MKPGIDILNTGAGHAEISFDHGDPIELERGRRIIEDMLRRGYLLFIEGDDGKVTRVLDFDEHKGRYIIGDGSHFPSSEPVGSLEPPSPPSPPVDGVEIPPPPTRKRGRPPKTAVAVPMTTVRATAMGRSAGG